jgi:hypothetical protein
MPPDASRIAATELTLTRPSGCVIPMRAPTPRRAPPPECLDILGMLLRQTVISRLRLAHPNIASATVPAEAPLREPASADDVEGFVEMLRWDDQAQVDACVESMIECDCGVDGMLLDLVPRAESQLRDLGHTEGGEHADITLGHWRLQELVERLSARFQATGPLTRHERHALISTSAPPSGRLQMQIVAESLNRDGWNVWCEFQSGPAELVEIVRCDWFALVLIATDTDKVEPLGATISALRRASVNPDLRILVMSPGLARRPDRLVRVGADAAAANVRQASVQAQRLLDLMLATI